MSLRLVEMTGNLVTTEKNGVLINIDESNLQRDDKVVLQTADIIPADLKLVEANELEVDEFDITGEIMPVVKRVEEDVFLYAGSKVVRGTGAGVVIAVGAETEYGKVLKQGWTQEELPHFRLIEKKYLFPIGLLLLAFLIQARQSTHIFALAFFYLILSVALLLLQNVEIYKYFLVSNERKRLERLGVQIRDANVLERMGNLDILCFDKTGVLTTRQMDVKNIYFADGTLIVDAPSAIDKGTLHLMDTACALCNDIRFFEKLDQANPIDKALVSFAQKNGLSVRELLAQSRRIYDQPFDSENRYMACGFELDGGKVYFAKGDPQIIAGMCSGYVTAAGETRKLDSDFWRFNRLNLESASQNGYTVVALAYSDALPKDYTYLCLLQLKNPLQDGVSETIRELTRKGVKSMLLTGDRAETAVMVAEECGIANASKTALTGRTLERMEVGEIIRQSAYCSVFARLIPSQKGFLIRLLQQSGHCVGMVGDGVNDGIALNVADIGISFSENSSVIARKYSNILIHDFADLLKLVERTRRIAERNGIGTWVRGALVLGILLGIYFWIFVENAWH